MKLSAEFDKLAAAMLKVQTAGLSALKENTANAEKFKFDYAGLKQVYEVVRPSLDANGLAAIWGVGEWRDSDKGPRVVLRLVHVPSGQYVESELYMPTERAGAQAVGSALTYSRRYLMLLTCNIISDDDDGEDASKPEKPPSRREVPPKKPGQDARTRLAELFRTWCGVAAEDLASAMRSSKRRLSEVIGADPSKTFSLEECEKACAFIEAQMQRRVDFADWSAADV
jgi:hypothetical protein